MKVLNVAEKPKVAKEIANALSGGRSRMVTVAYILFIVCTIGGDCTCQGFHIGPFQQSQSFPVFYISPRLALLPSFSGFFSTRFYNKVYMIRRDVDLFVTGVCMW
jgi:hypothetical protein